MFSIVLMCNFILGLKKMTKFVVFGLGMVGRSFLRLVAENSLFDSKTWYVIEKNPNLIDIFLKYGGKPENYRVVDVKPSNYQKVFSFLDDGDYLLDMSSFQGNTDLLQFCMKKDVHYLSTCSLPLEEKGKTVPDYHDFSIYRQIKQQKIPSKATSIIEFGMNPGMVSCFMKQAFKAIIREDDTPYIVNNRNELQNLIHQNEYALLAQKLGVEIIHISDIDCTEVNFMPENHYVYSTWNLEAFCDESTTFSELSLGHDVDFSIYKGCVDQHNPSDGYLRMNVSATLVTDQSFSPWGSFIGHIIPHEEIYTTSYFLSIYDKNGKLVYKPTSFFVYRPCEIALQSLLTEYKNDFIGSKEHLISLPEIARGGEAVGIVLEGRNFKTRYFGNKLEVPLQHDTPTILQVSASAFAAFRYILEYPNKGFLLPEELDDEKMLVYAKPYLKEYTTFTCPKLKRNFLKCPKVRK